ncbi:MAG: PH domain-containing protein [Pseudonocardiaceae bacterium]|nr:PH domain-containing protein [Pseudonocardiaceae bacterium]
MSSPALQVRPRRVRWVAGASAVALISVFTVVGVLLRDTPTGVYFRVSDQVAMVVLGALLAGAALLFTRPRLRAGADGIEVRNLLGARRVPWELVLAVSFPDGTPWARLELPDDEYIAVMAIQAADRQHAVQALARLRALHAEHAAPNRGRA